MLVTIDESLADRWPMGGVRVESEERHVEQLAEALCLAGSPEEMRAVLADLLSAGELVELAHRLEVARMLAGGASYAEVSQATGASSTTVSRVSKCLSGGAGGYRLLLGRLQG